MSDDNPPEKRAHEELIRAIQEEATVGYRIARALAELKQNNAFRSLRGFEKATWRSFIRGQSLLKTLSISRADRLALIYQGFIIELGAKPQELAFIDTNILLRLRTMATKENVHEWLKIVRGMKRSEFYDRIHAVREFYGKNDWSPDHFRKL